LPIEQGVSALKLRRHPIHYAASRVHKWLALIIGFQLILWFASGALMSFLPIDKVHGDHLIDRKTVVAIPQAAKLADVGQVVRGTGDGVETVSLHMLLGKPVYEVTSPNGIQLFDGATGVPLAALSSSQAQAVATTAWIGAGRPASVVDRVTAESTEYRGALPAWRVAFADPDHTRVFVTDAGKIAAVRTGTWRLYDFFWGLHIMDWSNHENFNTWWLLGLALGGLTLGLAGTVLLLMRWPIKRKRRLTSSDTAHTDARRYG
jgi:hypothetical protein